MLSQDLARLVLFFCFVETIYLCEHARNRLKPNSENIISQSKKKYKKKVCRHCSSQISSTVLAWETKSMMRKQEICCLDRIPQETMTDERLFHEKTLSRSPARPKPIPNGNKVMQHKDQNHASPSTSLISSSPWSIVSNDAFNQDESGEVSTPLSGTGSNSKGDSFEFMNSPRTARSFGCFSNSSAGSKERGIAVVPAPHSHQKISLGWAPTKESSIGISPIVHRPQNIDSPRQEKGSCSADKSVTNFHAPCQTTRQAPTRSGIAIARARQEELEEDDGFQLIGASFSNTAPEQTPRNDTSLDCIPRPFAFSKNSSQKYSITAITTLNNPSLISPKPPHKPSRSFRQLTPPEPFSSVRSYGTELDPEEPNNIDISTCSISSIVPPTEPLSLFYPDQSRINGSDLATKVLTAQQKKHLKPTLKIATDAVYSQSSKPTLLQSLLPNTVADGRYEALFDTIQDQGIVDGELVKALWRKSRIPDRILGHLWDQCDPNHQGLLDKQAFIQGMRAIDAFLLQHSQATNI
ncbi:hypothetical protein CLU79DRAFT_842877 [Phycomyces nitens]|nr:hypothetical protein CLU79DRAFT_842877 [Phycomyces nitens]